MGFVISFDSNCFVFVCFSYCPFVGEDEMINRFSKSQKFSHWHSGRGSDNNFIYSVMDIMIREIIIIGIIFPLRCGRSH